MKDAESLPFFIWKFYKMCRGLPAGASGSSLQRTEELHGSYRGNILGEKFLWKKRSEKSPNKILVKSLFFGQTAVCSAWMRSLRGYRLTPPGSARAAVCS
jgi:hypothetical protein